MALDPGLPWWSLTALPIGVFLLMLGLAFWIEERDERNRRGR